jgi:hypothetical protein
MNGGSVCLVCAKPKLPGWGNGPDRNVVASETKSWQSVSFRHMMSKTVHAALETMRLSQGNAHEGRWNGKKKPASKQLQ